jgi:outer membrane immunogenic protein
MKRILLAAIAAAGISVSAQAADMPVKGPVYKALPQYNWTGWYGGLNLGYTWGPWDASGPFVSPTGFAALDVNGALGGVQLGYNYQYGNPWVVGFEIDAQLSNAKDTSGVVFPGAVFGAIAIPATAITNEWKLPWFATVRGRWGALTMNRSLLIYGTGGLAVGEVKYRLIGSPPTLLDGTDREVRAGWTIGAGFEYAWMNGWTMKGEYLYMDLGTVSLSAGLPPFTNNTTEVTNHIVRIGLNRRFSTR